MTQREFCRATGISKRELRHLSQSYAGDPQRVVIETDGTVNPENPANAAFLSMSPKERACIKTKNLRLSKVRRSAGIQFDSGPEDMNPPLDCE